MRRHSRPKLGPLQPALGPLSGIRYKPMKTKQNAAYMRAAKVLAWNVRERMNARYRSERSESAKIRRLAEESGVGRSTIQRIVNPDTYKVHRTTLDKIVYLAMALRCETHELLMEHYDDENAPQN